MQPSTAVALAVAKLPGVPKPPPYILTVGSDYVWFQVPKVGSTSIYRLLGEPPSDFGLERRKYSLGFYRRRFKFAFVRNPWDRVVSAWRNKIDDPSPTARAKRLATIEATGDFDAFVQHLATLDLADCDWHWQLQSVLVDLPRLDFLGRFETFALDLRSVMDRIGVEGEIPHRNATGGDFRELYTPATRDLVARLYARDVAAFGYTFED